MNAIEKEIDELLLQYQVLLRRRCIFEKVLACICVGVILEGIIAIIALLLRPSFLEPWTDALTLIVLLKGLVGTIAVCLLTAVPRWQTKTYEVRSADDIRAYIEELKTGKMQTVEIRKPAVLLGIDNKISLTGPGEPTGVVTITKTGEAGFMTSIFGEDGPEQRESLQISVPLSTPEMVAQWVAASIPETAELPYAEIELFPHNTPRDRRWLYIIRNRNIGEVAEAIDTLGRMILLDYLKELLLKTIEHKDLYPMTKLFRGDDIREYYNREANCSRDITDCRENIERLIAIEKDINTTCLDIQKKAFALPMAASDNISNNTEKSSAA